MCNAGLTKYMQLNPNGLFLETSDNHLGLYHGDTSSHDYVCGMLTMVQQDAVNSVAAKVSMSPVKSPVSWHAGYCLNKFGKMTPGL